MRSKYLDHLITWGHFLEWGDLPPGPLRAFRRFSGLTMTGRKAADRLRKRYKVLRTMKHPEAMRLAFGDCFLDASLNGKIYGWIKR